MFADVSILNGRIISKEFVGFDVETIVPKQNVFRLGSFVFNNFSKTFFSKRAMIKFLYTNRRLFQGKFIAATNLQFDIVALFFGEKEFSDLKIIWNKSRIICVKLKFPDSNKHGDIIFVDTLNYNLASVKKLGQMINIPKTDINPNLFHKIKLNYKELHELKEYNINDALISKKYMEFFQKTLNELGGTCKNTISSCAFDLFRRQYLTLELLKESKILNNPEITEWIFKSYFGGRCEVFAKGEYNNVFYYDVNSLYPTVMINNFYPIPQSIKIPSKFTIKNIHKYFGVTECTIKSPNINLPILPIKFFGKLIFPVGEFKGVWTNELLKYALENGYEIIKIHRQIVYTKKLKLFEFYVKDLYELRLSLKLKNDPTEQTIKLFLNSLYGKFGQKKHMNYEIIPVNEMTDKKLRKFIDKGYDVDESADKKFFIMGIEGKNWPKNTLPIICSYVTSYAQIHMHKLFTKYPPLYTDTDSIITSHEIKDDLILGPKLGQLKCEKIGDVEIYSPKCYAFNKIPTVKGLYLNNIAEDKRYKVFKDFIAGKPIEQTNFIKLKAALRRVADILPNEKITIFKKLSENVKEKRIYKKDGSSIPLTIMENMRGGLWPE